MPSFNLQPFNPSNIINPIYLVPFNGLVNQYTAGVPKNLVDQKFPGKDDRLGETPTAFSVNKPMGNQDLTFDENAVGIWSDRDPAYKKSYLGVGNKGKIAENIVLTFIDGGGYDTGLKVNFEFERCLISVKQNKNIVETLIMGKNGSIKEYIGLKDYEVKLEAILFGKNGQFPADKVEALNKYLQYGQVIPVTCNYLNDFFNINYILVKDFDINMEIGGFSQQTVTITGISDNKYDADVFSPYNNLNF